MASHVRVLGLLCLCILAACSGGSHTVVPKSQANGSAAQAPPEPSVPNVFSAARGKHLTDAQLDSYIDPSVTGADRVLARRLMKLMPSNERGDFVYAENDKHVFSNNRALLARVEVAREPKPMRPVTPVGSSKTRRPSDDWNNVATGGNACTPRNPYENSGPYGRMESKCGFSGAIAFIQIPCYTSHMAPGDTGRAYIEVSRSVFSSFEGGLQYNSDTSIQNYMRVNPPGYPSDGAGNLTMKNSDHYPCSTWLGIAAGLVKVGGNMPSNQTMFTRVGILPSNVDPIAFWSGNQIISFDRTSWLFTPAPGDMQWNSGPDPVNVPAPCPQTCAVGKVTSIAQNSQSQDGSYFGIDPYSGKNSIYWLQVGFGNWQTGCAEGQLCTLRYSRDYTRYYGGQQIYNGTSGGIANPVRISGPVPLNFGPWQSQDGITLSTTVQGHDADRGPLQAFSSVDIPSCATDGYGYCVAQSGGPGFHEDTVQCMAGNYPAAMGPVNVGQQWFWVENTYGVMTKFTHHAYDENISYDCGGGDYWDPAEPNSYLGDPNLP